MGFHSLLATLNIVGLRLSLTVTASTKSRALSLPGFALEIHLVHILMLLKKRGPIKQAPFLFVSESWIKKKKSYDKDLSAFIS